MCCIYKFARYAYFAMIYIGVYYSCAFADDDARAQVDAVSNQNNSVHVRNNAKEVLAEIWDTTDVVNEKCIYKVNKSKGKWIGKEFGYSGCGDVDWKPKFDIESISDAGARTFIIEFRNGKWQTYASNDETELTCYRCCFGKLEKNNCGRFVDVHNKPEKARECPNAK